MTWLLSGGGTTGDREEAPGSGQMDKGLGPSFAEKDAACEPGDLRCNPSPTLPDHVAGWVS